jgi:hypothetical protein
VVADAIDLDKLRAYPAYGVALTATQRLRLIELEVKEEVRPVLLAQLYDPPGEPPATDEGGAEVKVVSSGRPRSG